ncbi:MAG: DUF4328 domain-containing protein [Actinomycetota bacterium]|jgi:Domain of unknown function (DUF4328)
MQIAQARPVANIGRAVQILLAVVGTVGAVNDVWLYAQLRSGTYLLHVPEQVAGQVVQQPYLTGSKLSSIGVLLWPLTIATWVVWLIWQHHATQNLWARGYRDLHIRPGWAVGWWFIPFASLVMPCVAMLELDRRSTPDGTPRQASPLVGAWWAVYIAGGVVVLIGMFFAVLGDLADLGRGADAHRTVFDLTPIAHTAAPWMLALGLVTAVAAGLAIAVVRRITEAQTEMLASPSETSLLPVPMRPDIAG